MLYKTPHITVTEIKFKINKLKKTSIHLTSFLITSLKQFFESCVRLDIRFATKYMFRKRNTCAYDILTCVPI